MYFTNIDKELNDDNIIIKNSGEDVGGSDEVEVLDVRFSDERNDHVWKSTDTAPLAPALASFPTSPSSSSRRSRTSGRTSKRAKMPASPYCGVFVFDVMSTLPYVLSKAKKTTTTTKTETPSSTSPRRRPRNAMFGGNHKALFNCGRVDDVVDDTAFASPQFYDAKLDDEDDDDDGICEVRGEQYGVDRPQRLCGGRRGWYESTPISDGDDNHGIFRSKSDYNNSNTNGNINGIGNSYAVVYHHHQEYQRRVCGVGVVAVANHENDTDDDNSFIESFWLGDHYRGAGNGQRRRQYIVVDAAADGAGRDDQDEELVAVNKPSTSDDNLNNSEGNVLVSDQLASQGPEENNTTSTCNSSSEDAGPNLTGTNNSSDIKDVEEARDILESRSTGDRDWSLDLVLHDRSLPHVTSSIQSCPSFDSEDGIAFDDFAGGDDGYRDGFRYEVTVISPCSTPKTAETKSLSDTSFDCSQSAMSATTTSTSTTSGTRPKEVSSSLSSPFPLIPSTVSTTSPRIIRSSPRRLFTNERFAPEELLYSYSHSLVPDDDDDEDTESLDSNDSFETTTWLDAERNEIIGSYVSSHTLLPSLTLAATARTTTPPPAPPTLSLSTSEHHDMEVEVKVSPMSRSPLSPASLPATATTSDVTLSTGPRFLSLANEIESSMSWTTGSVASDIDIETGSHNSGDDHHHPLELQRGWSDVEDKDAFLDKIFNDEHDENDHQRRYNRRYRLRRRRRFRRGGRLPLPFNGCGHCKINNSSDFVDGHHVNRLEQQEQQQQEQQQQEPSQEREDQILRTQQVVDDSNDAMVFDTCSPPPDVKKCRYEQTEQLPTKSMLASGSPSRILLVGQ